MTTKRILTLAAVGTLAAVSTVAFSVTNWLGASATNDGGPVRLHLGTDGQYFKYGSTQQAITVGKNSCAITNATGQPLINLASVPAGGNKASAPGLANYGLGVKESPSSGNGSPCAQVAGSEKLIITPGSLVGGRLFTSVQLDLELTGNAVAVLTLSKTGGDSQEYRLQTGNNINPLETQEPGYDNTAPYVVVSSPSDRIDACAAPNSSGPNNASNDNCQWNIDPLFQFDTITLSATIGTVSIEGGGDFANDPAHDTLFNLGGAAPVAVNDSADVDKNESTTSPKNSVLIDVLHNDTDADNDPLSIAGIESAPGHGTAAVESGQIRYTPADGFVGVDTFTYRATDQTFTSNAATVSVRICSGTTEVLASGAVTASFTRLTELDACKSNTVAIDATASTVLFQPEGDNASVIADYRGFISFGPKPIVLNGGAIELKLSYDASGGTNFVPVPWCDNPQFDADGNVTTATPPGTDTWCIASESTIGSGTDNAITQWQVFGQDDPNFK